VDGKISVSFRKFELIFKNPSGTSRGILTKKSSWFLEIQQGSKNGVGECSIIEGLSPDYENDSQYESKLKIVSSKLEIILRKNAVFYDFDNSIYRFLNSDLLQLFEEIINFPSIVFGVEVALMDFFSKEKGILFDNSFSRGQSSIPINGLVWMGSEEFMQEQIEQKLAAGFSTIKMKIGAIDFQKELNLLKGIRKRFSKTEITLRVDANGAFSFEEAKNVLHELKALQIHSIEQPLAVGQIENMRLLCAENILPIALDEEMIGINSRIEKEKLLDFISPHFIILKSSLHGGIFGSFEWIELAEARNIGWWITSALESSIGLNAIAQFTGQFNVSIPQGLGTGGLYTNNLPTDLVIENGYLTRKIN
jgi:L-alanine-DL-glutamate epimerase-like enolase superfamily enzyme